jgi:hypothetical protein
LCEALRPYPASLHLVYEFHCYAYPRTFLGTENSEVSPPSLVTRAVTNNPAFTFFVGLKVKGMMPSPSVSVTFL